MVKVTSGGKEFYLDQYLKNKLDNIQHIIKRNWDCVILIDGEERVGKSTLGMTIAKYLYPKFTVENISTGMEDAKKKIAELPDKSILMIDEGSLVFNSRDAMTKAQKSLMKVMNVVGQKNMIFIVILPSFFDLNRHIAVRRSRFLIHVYADKKMRRGRFVYFGKNKKAKLYEVGKKNFNSYNKPKSDFVGKFTKFMPLGPEYDRAKTKSMVEALKEKPQEGNKWFKQRNVLLKMIVDNRWLNQKQISKELEKYGVILKQNTISDALMKVSVS